MTLTMTVDNRFTEITRRFADQPDTERRALVSEAVGHTIPFVGTAGLFIETMTPTEVAVRLRDRRAVHNHVGGLHAAAMTLLAETATGLVVAQNVVAASVPLLRALEVQFRRRAEGSLHAVATLTAAEAERIQTSEIGKLDVPVRLTDESGAHPVECAMHWAWMPARRVPGLGATEAAAQEDGSAPPSGRPLS